MDFISTLLLKVCLHITTVVYSKASIMELLTLLNTRITLDCLDLGLIVSRFLIKGSSDPNHFIFEINVGKRRIRHVLTESIYF